MYPRNKRTKSLLGRLALVILMGSTFLVGSLLTIEASEKISKHALKEMIAGAKTASDHKAIADHYYAEAAKARAKAVEHRQMAGFYKTAGEGTKKTPYAPGTVNHCERLVKNYTATADELTTLAKEHEAMAAKIK